MHVQYPTALFLAIILDTVDTYTFIDETLVFSRLDLKPPISSVKLVYDVTLSLLCVFN